MLQVAADSSAVLCPLSIISWVVLYVPSFRSSLPPAASVCLSSAYPFFFSPLFPLPPLFVVRMHTNRRSAVPMPPLPLRFFVSVVLLLFLFPVDAPFAFVEGSNWPIEHSTEEMPDSVVVMSVDGFWIIRMSPSTAQFAAPANWCCFSWT